MKKERTDTTVLIDAAITIYGEMRIVKITEEQAKAFGFDINRGWKPRYHAEYLFIGVDGLAYTKIWLNDEFDNIHWNDDNVYLKKYDAVVKK